MANYAQQYSSQTKAWRIAFYVLWLLLSLFQSAFAELIHDEAYYWVCSQRPDIGYFFQPPITAWLIAFGAAISKAEWGVRLFFTLMSTGSIYFIERLLRPNQWTWFALLVLSVGLLHITGVMAVPDVPLFFFGALWLLTLRRYLVSPNYKHGLWLGLISVLMVYSKYHGLMLLGLSLLANLSLFKKKSFYLVILIGAVGLVPHLLWLADMDFQTLKFHFYKRGPQGFNIVNVLNYFGGQALIAGPLIGLFLWVAAWKHSAKDQFEKTLKFIVGGIYFFLLLLSCRGRVEANWSVLVLLPLLYFGYQWMADSQKARKWMMILGVPSIVLAVIARLFVTVDALPNALNIRTEFVGWQDWANDLKAMANDKPVVFMSHYQHAAKYAYYGDERSYSLGLIGGHKSDYDNWIDREQGLQGQDVLVVLRWSDDWADSAMTGSFLTHAKSVENFRSFSFLEFDYQVDFVKASRNNRPNVRVRCLSDVTGVDFTANPEYQPYVSFIWLQNNRYVQSIKTNVLVEDIGDQEWVSIPLSFPDANGDYQLQIEARCGWLPPFIADQQFEIKVVD